MSTSVRVGSYLGISLGGLSLLFQVVLMCTGTDRKVSLENFLLLLSPLGSACALIFLALLATAVYRKIWNERIVILGIFISGVGVGVYAYTIRSVTHALLVRSL